MSDLSAKEIELIMKIDEFVRWTKRDGFPHLGYKPPRTVILKGGRNLSISDDEAFVLDRALMAIKTADNMSYSVLMKYYFVHGNDTLVALDFSKSRAWANATRTSALRAWFYCWTGMRFSGDT